MQQDALELICIFNTLSEADLEVGVCWCHSVSNTCDIETLEPEDVIHLKLRDLDTWIRQQKEIS